MQIAVRRRATSQLEEQSSLPIQELTTNTGTDREVTSELRSERNSRIHAARRTVRLVQSLLAIVLSRSRACRTGRALKRHPPRRWVVEVAHSWFSRFRKLLVRYEKTHRSYLALNMLAAAIISFRRVPARINIIYG